MVAAAAALVLMLRFLPRLPFALRAVMTVLIIYCSALPTVLRSGFALSSGGVLIAAIVLAVILLGRGAAMSLMLATAAVLVWSGLQAKAGHFVPHPLESDPHLARNWFRMAIGMEIVAAALTSIVSYAVRHIEANYAEMSSALALLTGEQRRRSDLEQERQRIERDWARLTRELGSLAKDGNVAAGNSHAAFGALAEAGARGLNVERCGIWLFDEEGGGLRCRDLFERLEGRHTRGLHLPTKAAPAFFAAIEAERCVAAHRARSDLRTREMDDLYLERYGIGSLLATPIRVRGSIVGVVCGERQGAPVVWSEAQQTFAESLADIAARVLSAAERAARVLAARASTEELGEMLEALKLQVAGIPSGIEGWQTGGQVHSVEAVDMVLERVRQMSSALRAPSLDELGLVAALRTEFESKAAASGVVFELDASRFVGPSSPEMEAACYWVVDELVSNILGRTDTQTVHVRLTRDQDHVRIVLEDDGWGTPTNPGVPIWRRGPLVRVRERALALGGSVDVTFCEGAGSLVDVRLPDRSLAGVTAAGERRTSAAPVRSSATAS